jgi:amino acid adenylation domain-containing protein/non-ribosomal peptide synthase protein (TIGR01720 family)
VLGIEEVGAEENFFDLGGHSLLATMVVSRLQQLFLLDIPVRVFFQNPTLASLASYIQTEIASSKGIGAAAKQAPAIGAAPRQQPLPLSFAQQRLWFLEQMEPGSARYNIAWAVRITGPLNVEALEQSLNRIMERHEVLRTSILLVESSPVQVISEKLNLRLSLIDLSALPQDEQQHRVSSLARQEAGIGFDLASAPLMRGALMRLGEREHVLVVTMHHIISDGWSMVVLYEEMSAFYDCYSRGEEGELEELSIQYGDYAVWQREWLQGEVLEEQLGYWRKQLEKAAPMLEMPTDRPRPSVQSFNGATRNFAVPADITKQLKALCRGEGVTLFMTLLAAFQTLLYRYTGQEDISIGTPIAGRNRVEFEELIGLFANTLVLRTKVSRTQTFRQLIQRVRDVVLEAQAYQDLPFEKLVEELQPDRGLSHNPLFQVMFAFQSVGPAELSITGAKVTPIEAHSGTAKFDIDLLMEERDQQIVSMLEYSTDLFDDTTIHRMIGHLTKLLEGVAANPDEQLSALPLLSDSEQRQMLSDWNQTGAEYPVGSSVVEIFQSWAERTPHSIAAIFEDQEISYDALNRSANRMARALAGKGVGPEIIVALLAERDIDFLATILAIFKAGGAYLPLDPHNPAQRLSLVLKQSHAPFVITTSGFEPVIAQVIEVMDARSRPTVLTLEQVASETQSDDDLHSRYGPDQLAYVIFTSGSTSLPKGVMVEHRGMLNHLYAKIRDLALTHNDVVAQTASQCFDISVWQFLAALLVGGRVHMFNEETSHNPSQMLDTVTDGRITIFETVPTLLRMLLDEASVRSHDRPDLASLRWMIPTGESLPPQLCNDWFSAYPDIPLLNAYGPTECSDDVTHYVMDRSSAAHSVHVPIGRPVANMRMYILDADQRPVPLGVPGELHIGGIGVSRGYLNQPGLTAERFIPDPFGEGPGERLYKSGDYTRYLEDGNIQFLGRMDHQVKIRGFRIELGEIEAALDQHEGVRENIAIAREDQPGDRRLVAYVVPRNEDELTINALRNYLAERLPEYLVPSIIVFLPAMPVTASGKIDRDALPAPDTFRPLLEEGFVAPRSIEEKLLAEVWSQVLSIKDVGVNDNFFDLGGDSILSIQIVARANMAGLRITSKQLFKHQTISELAAVAEIGRYDHAQQETVTGPVPLSPIQLWFLEQGYANPHHYNQAVFLEIKHPVKPSVLRTAVWHLLSHHDALRLRFTSGSDGWRQYDANLTDDVPVSYEDLSALPADAKKSAIEEKAAQLQASLDLSYGPLLRVAQFHLGDHEPDRFLIIIHHMAVDGVSWRILLDDLQEAVKQLGNNDQVKLPPKSSSFKYWAEQLGEHANSAALDREMDFWLRHQGSRVPGLPVDHAGGDNTESSTDVVFVSLGTDETRALLQQVPRAYNTQINDVLLAALVKAFANWTGSNSLLVDLESHGREDLFDGVDISRTVGWFTCSFPVLLDLGETGHPGHALKSIKEQLRRIPNNGIGYGLLRYMRSDSSGAEKLGGLPKAEVSFNYLGQFNNTFLESSMLAVARESAGPLHNPNNNRTYLVEVDSSVNDDRLTLNWTYSVNIHSRPTIEALANKYVEVLRDLIAHCDSPEQKGFTPSDFPLANLDQQRLERIIARVGKLKGTSPK